MDLMIELLTVGHRGKRVENRHLVRETLAIIIPNDGLGFAEVAVIQTWADGTDSIASATQIQSSLIESEYLKRKNDEYWVRQPRWLTD